MDLIHNHQSIDRSDVSVTYFVVIASHRPDFIAMQMRSLRKFSIGRFKLIVLNNSQNARRAKLIESESLRLGALHYKVDFNDRESRASHLLPPFRFNRYRSPSLACSYSLHWFVKRHLMNFCGNLVFIDSDMFLVKPVDFPALLSKNSLYFIPQFRGLITEGQHEVMYPWSGFMLVNTGDYDLNIGGIQWSPKAQNGHATDVGGAAMTWLELAVNRTTTSEMLFFSILEFKNQNAKVSLNGNWNAEMHLLPDSDVWTFKSHDSLDLAARILKCDSSDVEDAVAKRLVEAIEMIEPTQWPAPLYVDLLSAPEAGLNDFVVHYKSGSNYQKWATPEYNSLKTRALTNCFPALT